MTQAQGMFEAAAYKEMSRANQDDYINARFAPIGNQTVGDPFPLFRQGAYMFTDYTPAGQSQANIVRQMNLPTNNTLARNTQIDAGVKLQNIENNAFVFRTQTLTNNGDAIACRNNTDCASWPGTTCNPQFSSWPDSKGNQGNYCSKTLYPELENGTYTRKSTNEGGIGKGCSTDNDCGSGYFCNNEVDMFGKNIQQTGYCSQLYNCPDGEHYMGYPFNSGIPLVPPKTQNNNGRGYDNLEECEAYKLAQQDCRQDSMGKYFAVYPGYCPVPTNVRKDSQPAGALPSTSQATLESGIKLPGFATNKGSSITKPLNAFAAWNINADASHSSSGMAGPLDWEISINPRG
jgi:hypothetical protein